MQIQLLQEDIVIRTVDKTIRVRVRKFEIPQVNERHMATTLDRCGHVLRL